MISTCPKPKSVIGAQLGIKQGKIADSIGYLNLRSDYNDFVTLQDIRSLRKVKFSDKFEVLPNKDLKICANPGRLRSNNTKSFKPKGKTVNFSEKFKDPNYIPDTEKYDIPPSSQQDPTRIKDKEL